MKKVRLAEFKPKHSTVEAGRSELVREIQDYLEEQIAAIEDGGDSLPVLQLE